MKSINPELIKDLNICILNQKSVRDWELDITDKDLDIC
jgi:hypothetical protein